MGDATKPTEPKKFSIGFKIAKPVSLLQKKAEFVKKEFITSINEGAIVSDVVKKQKEALIIPLPVATGSFRERLLCVRTQKTTIKDEPNTDQPQSVDLSQLTLEQRAAMEILAATRSTDDTDEVKSTAVIPSNQGTDGKDSTLDDYESIPVQGFGLAMLRGMGLKEEETSKTEQSTTDTFKFRPKNLGLGADSTIKPRALKIPLKAGEVLTIKNGAFVVVLAGKYKDFYGRVKDFDAASDRMVVALALRREKVVLSTSYVQLVTEKEFELYSKVPVMDEKDTKKDYGLIISNESRESERSPRRHKEKKERRRSRSSSGDSRRKSPARRHKEKRDRRRRSSSSDSRRKSSSSRRRDEKKKDSHRRHRRDRS